MTEKDLEDLAQEQVSRDQEEETVEEPAQSSSAFLDQWKQRHQAYLNQQEQESESVLVEEEGQVTAPIQDAQESAKQEELLLKERPAFDKLSEEESEEASEQSSIPSIALWKAFPVYLLSLLACLLAFYFISPLGKNKELTVTGNQTVSRQEIIQNSLIEAEDYTLTTLLQLADHARHIQASNEWIESAQISYQFPFQFEIAVKEYVSLGYVKRGEAYHPILSSGAIAGQALPETSLSSQYLLVDLKDTDLIHQLVMQLKKVDSPIVATVQEIRLTPSKATADLLTLTMYDGHTVLVPLSELGRKLPYYDSIAKQLAVPSMVDMEVGIFSYMKENQ